MVSPRVLGRSSTAPLGSRASPYLAFLGLALAGLLLASVAPAAVVTYPATDVPKTIDDGMIAKSVISGEGNLPVPTDVDLVGVQVSGSGPGSHTDKILLLRGPDESRTVSLLNRGCAALGFNITYDDQAGAFFSPPGDCTASGTRRPVLRSLNPLLDQGPDTGVKIEGNWTLELADFGAPDAGPATLSAWALRVTFAPMTFSASADKQQLRKKLEVTATCDADCTVRTSGQAKARSFGLPAFSKKTLEVPLKKKAFRRLRRKGKAKIGLEASNPLGDVLTENLKVKLIRGAARP